MGFSFDSVRDDEHEEVDDDDDEEDEQTDDLGTELISSLLKRILLANFLSFFIELVSLSST
jgi:hypothetical protein